MSPRPPLIVIGAGPVGRYAVAAAGAFGFSPILLEADADCDDRPSASGAAEALTLCGRQATAIWGDVETGVQVETDTGETVTGAAAIFADSPPAASVAGRPVTGLGPIVDAASGETAVRGVFVLGDGAAPKSADCYAAAARAVAAAAARLGRAAPEQRNAHAA